jgi:hypothetical protein
MNNEIVNAMEELENWLADPSELGNRRRLSIQLLLRMRMGSNV